MSDLDFVVIGAKIKKRRLAVGMTQEYIANKLDVNASHISNIEAGRAHPSLGAIVKIANILCCSVDCFLEDEYTFEQEESSIDRKIIEKIRYCDTTQKEKILKIVDLL